MIHNTRKALLLVLAIGVLWGLNWPAVKIILGEVPPLTLRAVGFSISAILLYLAARFMGQSLLPPPNERLPLAIAGWLTILGFNSLTAFGQLLTETSKAVIIAFTMPLWATLFAVVFLKEAFTWVRAASIAIGISGLYVLVSDDIGALIKAPVGPILILGAALSWAAGTVALKARKWTVQPLSSAAWMILCSVPLVLLAALIFETPENLVWPSTVVVWTFVYHIVFPTVVCYAVWASVVAKLPASIVAIGTLSIPITGVLSAGVILGDAFTATKIIALALIILSISLTFVELKDVKSSS
ncbi:MAG: DMT family transporter [Gammaproteobacteria bacterium]|nr:DMT family transporter [Gammaproteobacteria bacterium]